MGDGSVRVRVLDLKEHTLIEVCNVCVCVCVCVCIYVWENLFSQGILGVTVNESVADNVIHTVTDYLSLNQIYMP